MICFLTPKSVSKSDKDINIYIKNVSMILSFFYIPKKLDNDDTIKTDTSLYIFRSILCLWLTHRSLSTYEFNESRSHVYSHGFSHFDWESRKRNHSQFILFNAWWYLSFEIDRFIYLRISIILNCTSILYLCVLQEKQKNQFQLCNYLLYPWYLYLLYFTRQFGWYDDSCRYLHFCNKHDGLVCKKSSSSKRFL